MFDRLKQFSTDIIGSLTSLIAATALLGGPTGRAAQQPLPASSQQAVKTSPRPAATVPRREGQVKANGVTIAYESFGPEDREAVLMIMGNGAQLTAWPVELCEELVRRGYRVVIYDNRDVGLSTKFDQAGVPDTKANTVEIGASHSLLLLWVYSGPKQQGGRDSHATRTLHADAR
jgi:hypothetical protein